MRQKKSIAVEMMGLTNQLRRQADAVTARYGGVRFTGMQSFISSYIYDMQRQGRDVFQRDIEKEFYISRSTASGILKLMEKNGTVQRRPVPQDARLKKLVLTEDAVETMASIRSGIDRMDQQVEGCLTPEEQVQMRKMLQKMWTAVRGISEEQKAAAEKPLH